ERYRSQGVDVFLGEGRFVSRDTVAVGEMILRFRKAVVATGARAARPDIPGLAEAGFLTNESVFSLTELPRRLAVIGSAPIGCELAQAFARFGTHVSVIARGAQIMSREDAAAAGCVEQALRRDGVEFLMHTRVLRATAAGGAKTLELECSGKPR